MDDQIVDSSALNQELIDQGPVEMQMPAAMRERLAKRKEEVAQNKKDQQERQKEAQENASNNTINKIVKAQAHNQNVRVVRNEKRTRLTDPQNVPAEDYEEFQTAVLKNLALQEAKYLNAQRRQEKAAERRNQQIANKVQTAIQTSNVKTQFERDVQKAIEMSANEMIQEQRTEEAPVQTIHFHEGMNQEAKVTEQAVEDKQEEQISCLAQIENQEDQASSLAKPEEKVGQNIKVDLPMNIDMQVKKNAQEKQTMQINEQKTMIVGGNKLTFNISINVQVEPIE